MFSRLILILDEDLVRRRLLAFGLQRAGFEASEGSRHTGSSARSSLLQANAIIMVTTHLDAAFLSAAHALRTEDLSPVPAILLRADRCDASAITLARDAGFDDCLIGSIAPAELIARVHQAVDRRIRSTTRDHGLVLDARAGTLSRGPRTVHLAPTECDLMAMLLATSGRPQSRSVLLFRIWGETSASRCRVVDVAICRLRRSLETLGCSRLLQTIRGEGYELISSASRPLQGRPGQHNLPHRSF